MLASSTQETMEKAELVKGVKSVKPPIKPKPTLPSKPIQASVSPLNSAFKNPLSPSSTGAPCSPTSDIPSAVKISQLTGPQPYGSRRTSLKRWSSTVGEDVPSSKELLTPVETSAPDWSTKVSTQPLSAHVKAPQTGSVWKGKSPFILTTRGWGEQRSQGKDDHESESTTEKHTNSLASQDTDSKKAETVPLEENVLIDLRSSSTGEKTYDVNIQKPKLNLPFTSVPENVKNTPCALVTSEKAGHIESPAQANKLVTDKESSFDRLISTTNDLSQGTIIKSSETREIQDTKFGALNFKSDQETKPRTGISDSSDKPYTLVTSDKASRLPTQVNEIAEKENNYETLISLKNDFSVNQSLESKHNKDTKFEAVSYKDGQGAAPKPGIADSTDPKHTDPQKEPLQTAENSYQVENVTPQSKVSDQPQTISTAPVSINPSDILSHRVQDVPTEYNSLITEHLQTATLISDDDHQDAVPGYLQESEIPVYNIKEKADHEIPEKVKDVEEHLVSSGSQLTDSSVAAYEENTDPTPVLLPNIVVPEHYDFSVKKAAGVTVATDNSNKLHSDLELVGLGDTQSFDPIVESHVHFSEEHKVAATHLYDDDIGEESDHFKKTQQDAEATTQSGESVPHPTLVIESKHPVENRLGHQIHPESPGETKLTSASMLPGSSDIDKVPHHYLDSEKVDKDNLVSGAENMYLTDLSEKASHSYVEQSTFTKPEISPRKPRYSENYDLSKPGLNSSAVTKFESPSQDLSNKVTEPEEINDDYNQAARLQFYKHHSPTLAEHHLDKSEARESDELQYTHVSLKEHDQIHTEKPNDEHDQSHAQEQSGEPVQGRSQLENLVDTHNKSKEPSPVCTQPKEPEPKYQQSEKTVYVNDQQTESEEKSQRHKSLETSVHKYEELDEPFSTYTHSSEEPHHNKQSIKPAHVSKPSDLSVDTYDPSNELVRTDQQPEELESKYESAQDLDQVYRKINEIVQRGQWSSEPGHVSIQSDEIADKYEGSEESVHRHQTLEELSHKYEHSEERDNRVIQAEETVSKHTQRVEDNYIESRPVHSIEVFQKEELVPPVYQQEETEREILINTNFEDKSSNHDLLSLQQQNKNVHLEKHSISDIPVEPFDASSVENHMLEENLGQPRDSTIDVPKNKETSTQEEPSTKITLEEQDQLSEKPHLTGIHKPETKHQAFEEEAHHVDGLPEKPRHEVQVERPNESDRLLSEKPQDEEDTSSYFNTAVNGHDEHKELQTADIIFDVDKENKAQKPQETQPEESPVQNFDFLQGTAVLDTSYMRGRASLGKKRCHRTPATCASEEENDPEYWMFRDSTEPRTEIKSYEEEENSKEENDKTSPDTTPDSTPSPGKSLKKGGIFAGIKSPSILKGRLKSRSKTLDETGKQHAEESKSPVKEAPEPSSSLNWLQALKKKKKKQPK